MHSYHPINQQTSTLVELGYTEDNRALLVNGYLRNCEKQTIHKELPRIVIHKVKYFYNKLQISNEWLDLENQLNDKSTFDKRYDSIDDDIETIGCIQGCLRTKHLKCWLLSLTMLFWPICYVICRIMLLFSCQCHCETNVNKCQFPCNITYAIHPYWLLVVAAIYIVYICECFCSSTFSYLSNIFHENEFLQHINKVRTYAPVLWCDMKCGHQEYVDHDSTGANYEWNTTWRGTKHFELNSWKDLSTNLDALQLSKYKLMKINIDKRLIFSDKLTALRWIEIMEQYKNANKDRDEDYRFSHHWKLNGECKAKYLFQTKQIGTVQSFIWSQCCYVLCSLIGCSLCYRTWFSSICARKRYHVVKQVEL